MARTGQQTMRTGHLASSGWHLLNAEHVLMVNSCMPGTRRVQGRGQCAECRLQPEPVVDWVQHWRAAPGSPLNPAPHAHSGLRQGEQAWGNTAEQFFIKINRGGRAKGVLRASGVKPPLLARISGSLSCGAREVRSPCAWRGGARPGSRVTGGD